MGVYIKGMEMPVTCCHCPLMGYDPDREWYDSMAQTWAHICVLTGELIDNTKREGHCPLVPVPPHGRLIDADALYRKMFVGPDGQIYSNNDIDNWPHTMAFKDIKHHILLAPAIIPEEGE